MGNQNSNTIVDANGKQITRKCIIFVIPPGYEVNKMIDNFPEQFPYRYISIGELIRHQINKKTKYSKIILESLQKNKKISKQLLEILLKTVALRGNFMIRCISLITKQVKFLIQKKDSVLDNDQLDVWRQFMSKVEIQMIAIIKNINQIDQQDMLHHKSKKNDKQVLIKIINRY